MSDRNPVAGVAIVFLVIAGLLTPVALWTSVWGGYGGTAGAAIGYWVVIVASGAAAGGLSLVRFRPIRSTTHTPGATETTDRTPETAPARRTALPAVVGGVLLSIAVPEAIVLVLNLPGGHLREALAVTLVALVALGGVFLVLGIKRL